jgi:pilus assembly protein Flp/PilA
MAQVIEFLKGEKGATAIEYGLILTGIAIGILTLLSGIGAKINAALLALISGV